MDPTERVIAAIDGRETDRVATFSYYLDYWPVQQVLGKSLMETSFLMMNPVTGFVMAQEENRTIIRTPSTTIIGFIIASQLSPQGPFYSK